MTVHQDLRDYLGDDAPALNSQKDIAAFHRAIAKRVRAERSEMRTGTEKEPGTITMYDAAGVAIEITTKISGGQATSSITPLPKTIAQCDPAISTCYVAVKDSNKHLLELFSAINRPVKYNNNRLFWRELKSELPSFLYQAFTSNFIKKVKATQNQTNPDEAKTIEQLMQEAFKKTIEENQSKIQSYKARGSALVTASIVLPITALSILIVGMIALMFIPAALFIPVSIGLAVVGVLPLVAALPLAKIGDNMQNNGSLLSEPLSVEGKKAPTPTTALNENTPTAHHTSEIELTPLHTTHEDKQSCQHPGNQDTDPPANNTR